MTDAPNPYDHFAAAYAADNEANVWNALYERPAVLALMGDVAGKRVLDAGCGAGAHAAALLRRGAQVIGLDSSAGLLRIARARLGDAATLDLADLADPLPLPDGQVDAVLAALVMHYLEDWGPTLREFHRVLRPGGRFVMSTHHPFSDHQSTGGENYFAHTQWTETWDRGGTSITMRFWRRPLRAVFDAVTTAGFTVTHLDEPQPLPEARDLDPRAHTLLTTQPRFLFLAARRD